MQARKFFGPLCILAALVALFACGTADNPYSKFKDPPLVTGRLHTVILVSDTRAVADALISAGWQELKLLPNYQQADAVQASMWGVAVPVATAAAHYKSGGDSPDVCLLEMPLAAKGRVAEAQVNEAFFRNVLGTDVPAWPLSSAQPGNVRVQVWTYLVDDIAKAGKRLRENGIPVIYDLVDITTAYLGDHKTLAIRAPDGTVIQLVQTAAK